MAVPRASSPRHWDRLPRPCTPGPDRITVGVEINATHHRAATDGLVTGVTTLLFGGRTITTHEIVITNEAGRRVCTSRLTCMLMDRVRGRAAGAVPGSDSA